MKLGEFTLGNEQEERARVRALIESFNRTVSDYPRDRSLFGRFAEQVRRAPDAIAVIDGDRQFTYAEVARQAGRVAGFLVDHGLAVEGFVGVMVDGAFDLVTGLLGILQAGGAYVPLDPALPEARLTYMLRDTRARILIGGRRHLRQLHELQAACPDFAVLLCPDSDEAAAGLPAAATDRNRAGLFDARALEAAAGAGLADRGQPRGLAYVIYTSGTTGQPKGVMVEHRGILRLVCNPDYMELGPADRILMTGAVSFDASTFEIWGALLNGGVLCRPPEHAVLDAAAMKRLIRDHAINTLFLTTSLLNQMADLDVTMFGGLKTLLTGGEKASALHLNRIQAAHPDLVILNAYGPTENTSFTTVHRVERDGRPDIPIGRPIANTQVYILDAGGALAAPGVSGEICTAGDGLARGYLNDPELTRERFVPHPFTSGELIYRTGDLGRWRPDGVIEFTGRRDNQVKIRGFRIEPGEIEDALRRHALVRDAVVMARDIGEPNRVLVAYVAGANGLDEAGLRAHLEKSLPDYMVPAHFVLLPALPLAASGKVDRAALPPPDLGKAAGREQVRPETEVECQLVEIWEEVLGRRGVGVTDNFFSAGGHSLKVTRLTALIQQRLGVELPLTAVFQAVTVRDQARMVVDAVRFGVEGIDAPMVLLNDADGAAGRIFLFPPGTGDALGYVQLAEALRPFACYGFNFLEAADRLRDYADRIMAVDPAGPYVLSGYSAGGNLAYHVAGELEARGKRVAAVVMIDAGRVLSPIEFPADEWERVANEFLDHESIRPFAATPARREKVRRLIACYYDYLATAVDHHVVGADLHNLVATDSADYRDATGRVVVSRDGWLEITRGRYEALTGSGDHKQMLAAPHLATNTALLAALFTRIFSTLGGRRQS